ncbi:hypothetical protein OC683_02210 ['Crotalaria aegyptiaca' phytoplasma]|uniref:Chromosome segregation ATPase n=1 Tax=Candidatus Phytoplasma crotalariae TaxID=2982627 RepID=A0ABT9D304_9MOLU|nr:hypothetical protein ['Crotalaria aegyptiaca' phytoplasma]MDO8059407.1 hypothetical protein ['Crotalaria aegyptiaca' phytoplasma]
MKLVTATIPDQGSVETTTEPTFLPPEQLSLPQHLGTEFQETTQTPEEIVKAKNLLEIQLQQEYLNSLALATQKANLEYDLIQKQMEIENNQKLSAQAKQELEKEINYQTDQIRAKEKEILTQDQKINQLTMNLQQEKTINTEKEAQINQLLQQINTQNQITEQLQNQLQEQKSLIEAKNQELITNQTLSEQEKQALQKEINQLTTDFQQKEQTYQTTIYQQEQEIAQLNQVIHEQAEEITRLSAELEQQIDKWVQQGLHIQTLETTIKTLENTAGKYSEENIELRHEINKLKEQIKDEQKAHEATRVKLQDEKNTLIEKLEKFDGLEKKINDQTKTYSGAIQPLKNRVKTDIERVTSWFSKWF